MARVLIHVFLSALALWAPLSAALPSRPSLLANGNDSVLENGAPHPHSTTGALQSRAKKPFDLRIAALGTSIINGYLSTDGNGFRKYLRDELRLEGWKVNMVGSVNTGSMKDNQNEGHPGWTISQLTYKALPNIVADQPNLVLIHIGMDNANQNITIPTIAGEYIQLLDNLWAGIPNATVILSTLIVSKNTDTDATVNIINAAIRTMVMSHFSHSNIVSADMNDGFITLADVNNDSSPTDNGYKKMASVWWTAFQKVELSGWLTAP
ncbi:SGNH hydrolase-type esterase domain-containing protein, partial [Rhexocercosporidium sp. MPI-PUGE-AT-0058]